ncbi:MAG TPA: adenylate/guanylate cyclase domain-containing protein [Spirochaetia bacterium]|nr:adenylate/guanylate cyclase domain-containing protein [Spirochaetia bacterium]
MAKISSIKSGERRNATILFADLQGFTALSERMDPEEMDALMTRVFGAFEEIIVSRGGVVEKYIGDALVAVFGVPELHEDDPQRALESALAFLERNRALEGELAPRGATLSFRIGVHSGLIATGDRGSFKVVTGHPMAIAQRLQAAAEPDRVLVSDAVKERCDADFDFDGPIGLAVKGASDELVAWRLVGPAQEGSRDQGPFVGRRDELEELLRLYVRHDPQTAAGMYLVGEAGIGKSRLAHALMERVRRFPEFGSPVLSAKAQRFRPLRYAVVVDLVLDYLGVDSLSSPEAIASALAAQPGIERAHAELFASLLSPGAADDARARDSDTVLALFSIFSALMGRYERAVYPAFMFIDNAQAMDRQSMEFIAYYLRSAPCRPFALLAGREHGQSMRDAFPDLKALRLYPLARDEAAALASAYWPQIPDRLLEAVLAQAGGNPLFVREYALFARKHRDLSSLPGTIQNMFIASLERFGPAARELATACSVFLLNFDAEEAARVYEAAGGDPSTVPASLEALRSDGILTLSGERYAFALDVFRKALYSTILNHNKRILHGVVADIMLSKPARNRFRLIRHLMKAERWLEAADVIRSDPDRNYGYEYLAIIDPLYKRLAKPNPDAAVQLLITKSALNFNAGKIDEAEEDLKRVMRIAVNERNPLCMGFAYHMICAHNVMASSFQKARFTGQKALHYYRQSGLAARSVQNVVRHVALSEIQRGNFEEARQMVESTAAIPGRDEFEYASAVAEERLYSGDYRGALAAVESVGDRSDGSYGAVARFFGNDLRLKVLWQLCDFRALGPAAKALLDSGGLSDAIVSQAHAMLAASATLYGDAKAARESFMQAEYYADKVRNDYDRIESSRTLALCHFVAGNERKAETAAREALILGLRHSCYYPTFTALMLLVQIAAGRGDDEEAGFFLAEASYFFSTGFLLPNKDAIIYYYYAGSIAADGSSARSRGIARRLLEEEKARIGDPELVANFLASRGFGEIEAALDGIREDRP